MPVVQKRRILRLPLAYPTLFLISTLPAILSSCNHPIPKPPLSLIFLRGYLISSSFVHPRLHLSCPYKLNARKVFHPRSLKTRKIWIVLGCHVVRVLVPIAVILGVDVETLRVAGPAYGRDYRAPGPAVVDIVPIDIAEEWVLFHFRRAAADVAEAARAVYRAELADYVLRFGGYGGL
jgi:hypothetical protein